MLYNDFVRTCSCIVLWDGMTKPEQMDDGGFKHNLRLAIPETAPEFAELQGIANKALMESKWKGALPPNGQMPFAAADVAKFGPLVAGHQTFSAKTYHGAPQVFDVNGQVMPPQMYSPMLYAGTKVEVLVSAGAYDNKNKGIGFYLNGITIIDATAPKLDVGSGPTAAEVTAMMTGQAAGTATSPLVQTPAGALVGTAVQTPAPPPVTPNHQFVMTAKANGFTREEYNAQGWTDEMLREQGMMQ